jgi:hypothetical protein
MTVAPWRKPLLGLPPAAAVGAILVAAALAAGLLFLMTSWHELYTISGPVCQDRTLVAPGFDPWTGMPHGVRVTCPQLDPTTHEGTLPPDLVGRQAIPVPVGGAVGAGIAVLVLAVTQRRRREPEARRSDPEAT